MLGPSHLRPPPSSQGQVTAGGQLPLCPSAPFPALALCQLGSPVPHFPDGTIKPSLNLDCPGTNSPSREATPHWNPCQAIPLTGCLMPGARCEGQQFRTKTMVCPSWEGGEVNRETGCENKLKTPETTPSSFPSLPSFLTPFLSVLCSPPPSLERQTEPLPISYVTLGKSLKL